MAAGRALRSGSQGHRHIRVYRSQLVRAPLPEHQLERSGCPLMGPNQVMQSVDRCDLPHPYASCQSGKSLWDLCGFVRRILGVLFLLYPETSG